MRADKSRFNDRSATSSTFASSRPTTTDGTHALLPQPSRGLEVSGRRSAAVSSTHMQAQQQQKQHVAAQQQQQQLIQQLQQRRAALLAQGAYKRGAHQLSASSQLQLIVKPFERLLVNSSKRLLI